MTAHLDRDEIAGIAMLEPSDPERRRAEEHARECEACRGELEEALSALSALDGLAAPPAPPAALLARVKESVIARMARPSRAAAALVALLSLASFGLVIALGRDLDAVPWALAIAVLAITGGRTFLALARGTTRDGAIALSFSLGLAAVLALTQGARGAAAHGGLGCGAAELGGAVLPLASAWFFVRAGKLAPSAVSLAASAAMGAVAAQVAIDALCGDRHASHVLVFHFGTVVVSAIIGGILGTLPIGRPARA